MLPLNVTTPRDSYDCNYRGLNLTESLAEDGFKPLTVGSMRDLRILPLPSERMMN